MRATIERATGWPFPAVTDARHQGREHWIEIDRDRMYEFFEVLPPISFKGGFFVSEPADHLSDGTPVYAAVVTMHGRHFIREIPSDRASVAQALRGLALALDGRP